MAGLLTVLTPPPVSAAIKMMTMTIMAIVTLPVVTTQTLVAVTVAMSVMNRFVLLLSAKMR